MQVHFFFVCFFSFFTPFVRHITITYKWYICFTITYKWYICSTITYKWYICFTITYKWYICFTITYKWYICFTITYKCYICFTSLVLWDFLSDSQFIVYANFTSLAKTMSSVLFHLIWRSAVILSPSEGNTAMARGCLQRSVKHDTTVSLYGHITS